MIVRIFKRLLLLTVLATRLLMPSLSAQTQAGNVTYSYLSTNTNGGNSFIRNGCSPADVLLVYPQVPIKVNLMPSLSLIGNYTTNSQGNYFFSATNNAYIRVTPTVLNVQRGLVSTIDIVSLSRHILRFSTIDCPYQRIAADVTNDGKLDTADINAIRRFILFITPTFSNVPSVRFVPKAYIMPHAKHPDPQFLGDFWNSNFADDNGSEYPFNAKIQYKGLVYGYKDPNSWMNKLNEWRFSNDGCESRDWGFVAIVSGDVTNHQPPLNTGSSTQSFVANTSTDPEASSIKNSANLLTSDSLPLSTDAPNSTYRLTILATTTEKVSSFQFEVHTNHPSVKIQNIVPNTGQMATDWSKNLNQSPEMLKNGTLRALWVSLLEGNAAPFVMTDTPLLSYTVTADKVEYLARMDLDTVQFPALFYDEEGREIKAHIRFKVEKITNE